MCKLLLAAERDYRISVQAYADAVQRLDSSAFRKDWSRIEDARVEADRAREGLLEHIRLHHCVRMDKESLEERSVARKVTAS